MTPIADTSPREEITMTKSLMLPLTMAMCIALAPAAFAQTMAPQGSTMSNPSSDNMAKPDAMAKPDTMGKTDGMKKDEKTDAMKKTDDKTDTMKKDGMSGGMTK
jgi:pentapeptide MXKDX repeat protein